MAKDDYFVIAYKVLSYLYKCLKEDLKPDPNTYLTAHGALCDINENYWNYILDNLLDDGYITGIMKQSADNTTWFTNLSNCKITPLGIEYLETNSMMKKVCRTLKSIKEVLPF